jgi:predicted NBD/HSP70 family sugar kinase
VVGECAAAAKERNTSPAAIGVATGGWVDPNRGNVVYATGNLPGWSGTEIRAELERATGLPVAVENDANAMAVAEKRFGLAKSAGNFVAVTLGTGVGGGCYIDGRLSRGSHFLANAIGHITVEPGGLPCTCGQSGCLEVYANAAALVRYAGPPFVSAAEVARAAREGETAAREAVRTYAGYLARGLGALVHLLDPELIALSGGIAESNEALLEDLSQHMSRQVIGWTQRRLRLALSNVACFGGVMGASAVALDELDRRAHAKIR